MIALLSETEFWAWAAEHQIGLDPQFGTTGSLAFLSAPNLWKPWRPPGLISDAPAFITAALETVMPAGSFLLWRRGGGAWYDGPDGIERNRAIDFTLRGVGIPEDHRGALQLSLADLAELWVVVLAFFVYGWGVGEDLYILPLDGSALLMVSHHGELVVTSPSVEHQEQFTRAMLTLGYADPVAEPSKSIETTA